MSEPSRNHGPRSGTTIGPYLLHEEIGRGGMGVVYRATRADTGLEVAVKLMLPELSSNARFRERFVDEVQTAPHLDHAGIVPVYDAGEIDSELYIAMALIQGADLKQVIVREGTLDPKRVLAILKQIGAALDYAHGVGVVHRDVKPQNILLSSQEEPAKDVVYITDFGLVKPVGSESTASRTGEVFGSIQYMAPEQIEGLPTDGRADVYSLGCVAYEALTGVIPFDRPNEVAVLWAHMHENPPRVTDLRPELAGGLDVAVANAMAKHPDDRHLTCGEFADALEQGLAKHRRTVVMPLVRPLVKRAARKKTEREVWAPNFFPELSRVRKLADKTNWGQVVAVTVASSLLIVGTIQFVHPQGLAGAAGDVAGAADSLVAAVTGSEPEARGEETTGSDRDRQRERQARRGNVAADRGGSSSATSDGVGRSPKKTPQLNEAGVPVAGIVFTSWDGEPGQVRDREIYKTDPAGSGVKQLTENNDRDDNPSWSPDGRLIAFTRTVAGPESEIWVMRRDGSRERRVLALGAFDAYDTDLSWSPNGKRIVYSLQGIWVVDIDGTGKEQLLGPQGSEPEWSPDGTRIVFSRDTSNGRALWVMNPDGSRQRQLTEPSDASGGAYDSDPTWTPDGEQIAFVRGIGFGAFAGNDAQVYTEGIFVIDADGNDLRRVSEGRGEFEPSSSPSGNQFVYIGGRDGSGFGDLFLVGLDGSGKTRLTSGAIYSSPDWRWPLP